MKITRDFIQRNRRPITLCFGPRMADTKQGSLCYVYAWLEDTQTGEVLCKQKWHPFKENGPRIYGLWRVGTFGGRQKADDYLERLRERTDEEEEMAHMLVRGMVFDNNVDWLWNPWTRVDRFIAKLPLWAYRAQIVKAPRETKPGKDYVLVVLSRDEKQKHSFGRFYIDDEAYAARDKVNAHLGYTPPMGGAWE